MIKKEEVYFSVIIPTLNEEKYLARLLSSFASQTFSNFEIIVVDGMSDDGTEKIFQKFTKFLPSAYFINSKERNVAYQRNLGTIKACGKYLIFLDADVNIANTFLEELHLSSLKQKFNLATTWIAADSRKPIDKLMVQIGNLAVEIAKGIGKPFSGGYNTIVKKNIFEKIGGFREDLKISEDHDFAIRAYKKNIELTILKEPQVIYSLRRFRSEGTLQVLRKYAQVQVHNLLKGPITSELFDYPMGGHVHRKRKRKIDLTKIDTYLKGIEKLEKKLNELLSE